MDHVIGDTRLHVVGRLCAPALHGVGQLQRALHLYAGHLEELKDLSVGTWIGSREIRERIERTRSKLQQQTESYCILRDKDEVLIAGYDDRGLLYGCLEVCEQLQDGTGISYSSGTPRTAVRGIYSFLHNRDLEREWFFSRDYWEKYLDLLTASRFNSLNLVVAHQTSYLAPLFPYFLHQPDFPEVSADDIEDGMVDANAAALHMIGRLCAERGISFMLGIWQVRAWKGGEGDWRPPQPNHVHGLTDENLTEYTYASLKQLLETFPEISGLQIRSNEESGIPRERQAQFFTDSFFRAISESDRPVLLDFRCWRAEQETIDNALSMCPHVRLSVKYWAEFMGQPYQPAKISPGYSYANFLEKPARAELLWQVWSLGSPRLLLWGDPAYVRRFAESLQLGDGVGFEINPHLTQKGFGNEAGTWRIFRNRKDEYYTWEFERYWYFHQLFGRLSYDPSLAAATVDKWFAQRFGDEFASEVRQLYSLISTILPFLVQYSLNDPNMYAWPEIDMGGVLQLYLETPSSDPSVIATPLEYADALFRQHPSGRFGPDDAARYLREKAVAIWSLLGKLPEASRNCSLEYRSTIRDASIVAMLAQYHEKKTLSAKWLALYERSGDATCLYRCRDHIHEATARWEQLAMTGAQTYYSEMVTGPLDTGDWKRKLLLVYEDEIRIEEMIRIAERYGTSGIRLDFGGGPPISVRDYHSFPLLEDYHTERLFTHVSNESSYSEETGFGFLSADGVELKASPEVRLSDKHTDTARRDSYEPLRTGEFWSYGNMLFRDYLYGFASVTFRVDLAPGDYEVVLLFCDHSSDPSVHGPFSCKICGEDMGLVQGVPFEDHEVRTRIRVSDQPVMIELTPDADADWFLSALLIRPMAPVIGYTPQWSYDPGSVIEATVTCPDPVVSVALDVRASGGQVVTYPMVAVHPHVYATTLPMKASWLDQNPEYQFRAISEAGEGAETDPRPLPIKTGDSYLRFGHEPVGHALAGADIEIRCTIESAHPLTKAVIWFSHTNQFDELECTKLSQENGEWVARISGSCVDRRWDLLYFFEAVDKFGVGCRYPDFRERTPYYLVKVNQG